MPALTPEQVAIASLPLLSHAFLRGPASCGKSTAGVARLQSLLESGVRGDSVLVLTPQRTLQEPYLELLHSPGRPGGGDFTPATVGGLARRMVELFWPLVAEAGGFAHPDQPPVFLTLETSQYYMARLLRPLLDEQGWFASVTIDRNRLYAQVLDNLNKSAGVGFPFSEIGARLEAAWAGEPAQRRVYADVQAAASLFRTHCLEHNLLDFSLQLEIFMQVLWPQEIVHSFLRDSYRHLIYDNLEEDIPRAHDLLAGWLEDFDSALLIFDEDGGYRRFLGADPASALTLGASCPIQVSLTQSFTVQSGIAQLAGALARHVAPDQPPPAPMEPAGESDPSVPAFSLLFSRYTPELLDTVVQQTAVLVDEQGIPPDEIVLLAPYLSDALRFALMHRLQAAGIPVRSHRPSRSLRDEPASHCLLTLAALAHPAWGLEPSPFDVAYALMLALDLDLVRAQLLSGIIYRGSDLRLSDFDEIRPEVQERITYRAGARYTTLRNWLLASRERPALPLDHFLRQIFGEVLSQPGFGFHSNLDHARLAASLVESVRKFRLALSPLLEAQETDPASHLEVGRDYLRMLEEGVIAAQYLEGWQSQDEQAVLVAPAHTFLMMNRPATVQFWLDAGSAGWTERLSQPLTHPYVLARAWDEHPGHLWTDADEVAAEARSLQHLVTGLLRRCRAHLYLGLAALGESGFEQTGGLVRAFQRVLQEQGNP
jgi:hypothetical protein